MGKFGLAYGAYLPGTCTESKTASCWNPRRSGQAGVSQCLSSKGRIWVRLGVRLGLSYGLGPEKMALGA